MAIKWREQTPLKYIFMGLKNSHFLSDASFMYYGNWDCLHVQHRTMSVVFWIQGDCVLDTESLGWVIFCQFVGVTDIIQKRRPTPLQPVKYHWFHIYLFNCKKNISWQLFLLFYREGSWEELSSGQKVWELCSIRKSEYLDYQVSSKFDTNN